MEDLAKIVGIVVVVFLASLGLAWIGMICWNAVVPLIFGLPVITFWQFFMLGIVTKLLFIKVKVNIKKW